MTPIYRVKDPAEADLLLRSFEARSPAKEPGLLFFHCSTEHSAGAASTPLRLRSARSFTTCTECRAGSGPRSAHQRQAPRPSLGCPAPSRVCPRTSTDRFGVHVRSGGRLSRAAMHSWLAQASRVACGHSRDGALSCLVSSMEQSTGLRSRRLDVQVVHEAPMPRWTSGEVLGPSSRRGGFDSRTGYHVTTRSLSSSSRFEGRKPAATIGRRRNPLPTTLHFIRV